MKEYFALYSDHEQTELLACAEDIDGVLEESKYYSFGVWFQYDEYVTSKGSTMLIGERLFKDDGFPEEPEERPELILKEDQRVAFN